MTKDGYGNALFVLRSRNCPLVVVLGGALRSVGYYVKVHVLAQAFLFVLADKKALTTTLLLAQHLGSRILHSKYTGSSCSISNTQDSETLADELTPASHSLPPS